MSTATSNAIAHACTRRIVGRAFAAFVESLIYTYRVFLFLPKSGPSFTMVTWSEQVESK